MAEQKREPDDLEQSKRFIAKAKELEADESGQVFEKTMKRILRPSVNSSKDDKK